MKKTIIALAALAFSGAVLAGGPDPMAAPAAPQDSMYLGFHADMTSNFASDNDNTLSDNMAFRQGGFQVGMMFGAIRAEVLADYGSANVFGDTGAQSYLSVFLKGAYDLQLGHGLSVYPVAGIGLVHNFDATVVPAGQSQGVAIASETNFAWLLGAGTTLALNDKTSISGEYNWVNVSNSGASDLTTGMNVFSIRWNRTF